MDPRRIVPPTPPFGQPAVSHPVAKPGTPAAIAKPAAITAAPTIKLDAAGRIDEDVVCRKCGYNLRGLSPDGRCPECGTAVGRSLQGDFLQFCDPMWVKRLAFSVSWLLCCVAIGILGGFAMGILAAATGLLILIQALYIGVAIASLYGYWIYTTPDPGKLTTEQGLTARKLIRLTQIAGLVLIPVSGISDRYFPLMLSVLVDLVTGAVAVTGIFVIFIYTRQLARRIPDEKLATSFGAMMWGIVVLVAITLSGTITVAISETLSPTGSASPTANRYSGGASCVSSVASLVILILLLITAKRFRRALQKAATHATTTWAMHPQSQTQPVAAQPNRNPPPNRQSTQANSQPPQ